MTCNKIKIKYRTLKLPTIQYFTVFPDGVSCTSTAVVASLVNCSACSTVLTRKVFAGTLENKNTMESRYPEFRISRTFRYLELEAVSPGVDLCQCIAVILCWISRTTRCIQPFLMVPRMLEITELYCTEKVLSTLSVDFRKVLCSYKLSQTSCMALNLSCVPLSDFERRLHFLFSAPSAFAVRFVGKSTRSVNRVS